MDPQPNDLASPSIEISVRTEYLPEQSVPAQSRFVFAYHIQVRNLLPDSARLLRRYWLITDAEGRVQEVEGEGVVGQKPRLSPGQSFEYTSGCVLQTDCGTMQGHYQMQRADGALFRVAIKPFALRAPGILH